VGDADSKKPAQRVSDFKNWLDHAERRVAKSSTEKAVRIQKATALRWGDGFDGFCIKQHYEGSVQSQS